MYVVATERLPIKIWLPDNSLDEKTMETAKMLANLPYAHHHVAIMPDAHPGIGMCIGGVLATKGVIVPSAVGVDIGCGMQFFATNIPVSAMLGKTTGSGELLHAIISNFARNVPTGFAKHKQKQEGYTSLETQLTFNILGEELADNAMHQLGTLGGGNHFIELQVNEEGMLCFMLHSGSRNMGNKLAQHYMRAAKDINAKYFAACPQEMAFLPVDSDLGQGYLRDMNLALNFAEVNRHVMTERCKSVLLNMVEKYCGVTGVVISHEVKTTHNYASLENHFGENVWVHRKGAIRTTGGVEAIIPGSCGTGSYIVTGRENADSFHSASHGSGRTKGRKAAKASITREEAQKSLQGIVYINNISKIIDETPMAYKNIEDVIKNESDLVTPLMKLKPIAFLKGEGEDE
jgi:tRNA-splicing ligase RtcB